MSRQLFVVPEVVRLSLFDDGAYWVSVKKQLNAGEERLLVLGAFSRMSQAGPIDAPSVAFDLNVEAGAFAKVLTYLVDWNLTNGDGKTVAIDTPLAKRDAVRALAPDVYQEIERAIDAHVLRSAQEKKLQTGSPLPGTI